MPSFEALKKLLRELGVKIDTSISDVATETTLRAINTKMAKCNTDNVKITDSVGYNSALDAFKFILHNDQVGIAREETLQSIDEKITKCDTDNIRLGYSKIAYDPYNDEFKVHDSKSKTIWDYMVEQGKAFEAGEIFSIGSDSSTEVLFANPQGSGKTIKVRLIAVIGKAEGKVERYVGKYGEEISITSNGTEIPKINKKPDSPNISIAILEYGGTYSNSAKAIKGTIPGGSGVFAQGGQSAIGLAGIIPEGYAYLIKITNDSSSTTDFSILLEWWEE